MTIYDLRVMCPRLDRFWYHEYAKKVAADTKKNNTQTLDIFSNDQMRGLGGARGKRQQEELDMYNKVINENQKKKGLQ